MQTSLHLKLQTFGCPFHSMEEPVNSPHMLPELWHMAFVCLLGRTFLQTWNCFDGNKEAKHHAYTWYTASPFQCKVPEHDMTCTLSFALFYFTSLCIHGTHAFSDLEETAFQEVLQGEGQSRIEWIRKAHCRCPGGSHSGHLQDRKERRDQFRIHKYISRL